MDKFAILLGYFDKQQRIINKLKAEVVVLDLAVWANGYVFALKTQQLFTAIEDLLKQIAKAFENHIEELGSYHRELLQRMAIEIPGIRPKVIATDSLLLLDKVRAFGHFIRHAYDCELDTAQLHDIQQRIAQSFGVVQADLELFRAYIVRLSAEKG